jgi:hypothetical protein
MSAITTGQAARIGKQYPSPISKEIIMQPLRMTAQDISFWQRAIDAARNPSFPRRRLLYDLFNNIKFDGHLLSVNEKRKMAVTNKKVNFITAEGTENEAIQDNILQTPWFFDYQDLAMNSVSYGHELIELKLCQGVVTEAVEIPHHNVSPERGFLFPNYADENTGFYFRGEHEDLSQTKNLIEIGKPNNYGLLFSAAPYAIFKRGGFGDWAQFAEIFGMPFRTGEYDPFDEEGRKLLNKALNEMGGAGYMVHPKGTSIQFHESTRSNSSDLFSHLVDACNKEMSKIYLGQTMTTEDGSSRSQANVHKEVDEATNVNDLLRMEYLHNFVFKKKMATLGAPEIMNGKLVYETTAEIPLEKQIEIDMKVAEKVEIDPQYWYEKYGVPKPDKIIQTKPTAETKIKKRTPEIVNLSLVNRFTDMHTKINELYSGV